MFVHLCVCIQISFFLYVFVAFAQKRCFSPRDFLIFFFILSLSSLFSLKLVICRSSHHILQSMNQLGKIANTGCGQLSRKIDIFLSPFVPESLVLRNGLGRPVPRQPAYSPLSGCILCLLTRLLPISAAASIYLYRPKPSGQSRVYQVTQLGIDAMAFTAESPPAQGQ